MVYYAGPHGNSFGYSDHRCCGGSISACAVLLTDSKGPVDADITVADLKGHWYNSSDIIADTSGNITFKSVNNDRDMPNLDFDIFPSSGSSFSGSMNDMPLAGDIKSTMIHMSAFVDGQYMVLIGFIMDKSTIMFANGHIKDQGDGYVAGLLVYTKDSSRQTSLVPEDTDLVGVWKLCSDMSISNGVFGEYGLGDMEVVEQYDNVFKGNMVVGGENNTIKGVVLGHHGSYGGIIMSKSYGMRAFTYSDGLLTLEMTEESEEDAIAVCGIYSRSQEQVDLPESGLASSSWMVSSASTIDGYGVVTPGVDLYTLIFGEERNGVLSGTKIYAGKSYPVAAVVVPVGGAHELFISSYEEGENRLMKAGFRVGDSMVISCIYTDEYGTLVARQDRLDPVSSSGTGLEGHWYLSHLVSHDTEFKDLSVYNYPQIGENDLDIYKVEDGLVQGYTNTCPFIGTYKDQTLIVEGSLTGDLMVTSFGWLENDDTLTVVTMQTGSFDGSASSIALYAQYTKDWGTVSTIERTVDITGRWVVQEAVSMIKGGEVYNLVGKSLNVEEQNGRVFYGNMEQSKSGKLAVVGVKGIITQTPWGTAQGEAVDDDGHYWNIQYVNGCLLLNTVDHSPIAGEVENDMNSTERRFIREGAEDPGFEYDVNIAGSKYLVDSVRVMDIHGNIKTSDETCMVIMEHQYNNCLSGYVEYQEIRYDFVAYLMNNVGQPMFKLFFGLDGSMPVPGFMWRSEGQMSFVINYEDADGVWNTVMAEYTKVT
jgi:hypothetical protein